jgi:hypothetical protein
MMHVVGLVISPRIPRENLATDEFSLIIFLFIYIITRLNHIEYV